MASSFLSKLGCLSPFPPPILECDNHGATYLIANPVFHSRMKHVDIDFQFVCDMVAKKELQVQFIDIGDYIANVLTKALSSTHCLFSI